MTGESKTMSVAVQARAGRAVVRGPLGMSGHVGREWGCGRDVGQGRGEAIGRRQRGRRGAMDGGVATGVVAAVGPRRDRDARGARGSDSRL